MVNQTLSFFHSVFVHNLLKTYIHGIRHMKYQAESIDYDVIAKLNQFTGRQDRCLPTLKGIGNQRHVGERPAHQFQFLDRFQGLDEYPVGVASSSDSTSSNFIPRTAAW